MAKAPTQPTGGPTAEAEPRRRKTASINAGDIDDAATYRLVVNRAVRYGKAVLRPDMTSIQVTGAVLKELAAAPENEGAFDSADKAS